MKLKTTTKNKLLKYCICCLHTKLPSPKTKHINIPKLLLMRPDLSPRALCILLTWRLVLVRARGLPRPYTTSKTYKTSIFQSFCWVALINNLDGSTPFWNLFPLSYLVLSNRKGALGNHLRLNLTQVNPVSDFHVRDFNSAFLTNWWHLFNHA